MSRRIPLILIILGCFALLFALVALLPPQPVSAQCKNPSTCQTCHEVQAQKPVNTVGDWHIQHATFDFCSVCHGGDNTAADKTAAHQGLVTQLKDMPSACKNCHADDLEQRFNTYAQILGVTDTSGLSAAQQSGKDTSGASSFLGVKPAEVGGQSAAQPTRAPVEQSRTGNSILLGLLVVGIVGGGGYIFQNERRLRASKKEVDQ